MSLIVLPALIPNVTDVYDVYFSAFKDDLITKLLYPGGVDREAHKQGTIQWWSHDGVTYTVKCVDQSTGDTIGMATWEVYWEPKGRRWNRPEGIPWLTGEDKEKCESILGVMWDKRQTICGQKPHICMCMGEQSHILTWANAAVDLMSMAVHPDHQRRGAGRRLVQWGIDLAEQFNLPIYAESSAAAFRLYQKVGFEKVEDVKLPRSAEIVGAEEDLEVPIVVRMPVKEGKESLEKWIARS